MTVLNGHFDGKQIVLAEPIPEGLAPNTPVTIFFESPSPKQLLDQIADAAIATDEIPTDYSQQHGRYHRKWVEHDKVNLALQLS